jgi:hypothetical protein
VEALGVEAGGEIAKVTAAELPANGLAAEILGEVAGMKTTMLWKLIMVLRGGGAEWTHLY